MQFPQWWKVSDYLKTHAPAETQEATKAPYSWAMGKEGKTYYEVMEEDSVFSDAWHKGIMMNEAAQPVTGMFPFECVKAAVEAEPHRVFIVDVGGGRGNALKAISKEYSGSYGAKMILQDMDEVLNGNDPVQIDGVDIMSYNFFEEQPVKSKSYPDTISKKFKLIGCWQMHTSTSSVFASTITTTIAADRSCETSSTPWVQRPVCSSMR
jgi:hypothetical protein